MKAESVRQALARRGIVQVSDNLGEGQRVELRGSTIFALFRQELIARYVRYAASPPGQAGQAGRREAGEDG